MNSSNEKNDFVKEKCPTCQQQACSDGHLCVPITKKDEKCEWCGSLIADQRHLCKEKVRNLSYICNSCGRTAVRAELLCDPKEIE